MIWYKQAWNGETKLYIAFWIYYVLFQVIFVFMYMLANVSIDYLSKFLISTETASYLYFGAIVIYYILWSIWLIWASVAVWKSATNCNLAVWLYLSRAVVLIYLGYIIGVLLVYGFLILYVYIVGD